MKLLCTKGIHAHWGSIFEEGKRYDVVEISERKVGLIADYESYWEKTSLIAQSIVWLRRGYTEENMHEAMPGYISTAKVKERYVKEASIPHATIRGEKGQTQTFCIATDEELYRLGADVSAARNESMTGRPATEYTVSMIGDHFEWPEYERERKLKELGL